MSRASRISLLRKSKSKTKIANVLNAQSDKSGFTVDFQFKFQSICAEHECNKMPAVETLENLKDTKIDKGIPIVVIACKPGSQEELDKIFIRNFLLETAVFLALKTCLEDSTTLTVLKYRHLLVNTSSANVFRFEFCNMTAQQIDMLADILVNYNNIKEVSINGNPNDEQNFHLLLLPGTNLQILSLKCCSIDSGGMEKISKELSKPYECSLLHLNLASNLLFEEGIDHIINILRINRILISLNLADNKLYDEGCIKLMQPLQKFPLYLPEIIIRRHIHYNYLKKKNLEDSIFSAGAEISRRSSQITKRSATSSQLKVNKIKTLKRLSKDKASLGSKESVSSRRSISTISIESQLEPHPFVQDSYEEEFEVYCKGNDTLINLTLSYNRITKEGLNAIIQMLSYQRSTFPNNRGISRISLEGNDFTNNCEQELLEFDDLINRRSRRSSHTSNKRSSTLGGSARISTQI